MTLAHTTALVTGTDSRGIGRAAALALAKAGADVALHWYRNADAAEALAAEIRALGRRAVPIQGDFADPAAPRRVVDDAVAALGGLGLLVCNAGFIQRKAFLELTDADWDALLTVDLKAYFTAGQQAARHMTAAGRGGRIVFISSVNQTFANLNTAHYCAAKGGVMMLGRAMALELAPLGITVNMIAPGTIETDINRHQLADPAYRATKLAPVPAARAGTPDDIAEAVVFLCSQGASYLTGSTLTVDGGLTISCS